jgi:hypothetical protein
MAVCVSWADMTAFSVTACGELSSRLREDTVDRDFGQEDFFGDGKFIADFLQSMSEQRKTVVYPGSPRIKV